MGSASCMAGFTVPALRMFYHSPVRLGDRLWARALAAGVTPPVKREDIW